MSERTELARERLHGIADEHLVPEPFLDYFRRTAEFLLKAERNQKSEVLYEDILPGRYARSYSNPDYACGALGEAYGRLLSAVSAELYGIIPAVFEGDEETEAALLELFLGLYFEFENDPVPEPEVVRGIFSAYVRDYLPHYTGRRVRDMLCRNPFVEEILMGADLSDPAYLDRFGEYITEDTRKISSYLASVPEETIDRMASVFVGGFRDGFAHAGKDLSKKRTVQIVYDLGFERMIRRACVLFREMGLEPTFVRYSPCLAVRQRNRHGGWTGASPNPQFDYDHREDLALVLNEDYAQLRKRVFQEAFEALKKEAGEHAGPAVVETFGEETFSPAPCRSAVRFSAEQQKQYTALRNDLMMIQQRYIPEKERSFTIIAFPLPVIGPDFEAIFNETIRINTLDSALYSDIQQKLIDALDRGYAVRVLGGGGNETDLTVSLQSLRDPGRETIFENCVADVNIPVGEVFTSPRLEGTNGLLHVRQVYLEGLFYRDLRISFRDGMTETCTCKNFDTEEENRAYIGENVLFHHPSLPLGEFAIGTNTTAYRMGRKFGIEEKMPILIAEKTGPHFAVGDTCYSRDEDTPVFNPDGKEVIARDNEHTLVRKTDPSRAYYGCHTDITIPYGELGRISVLCRDGGEIDLIRDGRFVLPGTEILNGPLDEAEG